jgi:hypothetical protein
VVELEAVEHFGKLGQSGTRRFVTINLVVDVVPSVPYTGRDEVSHSTFASAIYSTKTEMARDRPSMLFFLPSEYCFIGATHLARKAQTTSVCKSIPVSGRITYQGPTMYRR